MSYRTFWIFMASAAFIGSVAFACSLGWTQQPARSSYYDTSGAGYPDKYRDANGHACGAHCSTHYRGGFP